MLAAQYGHFKILELFKCYRRYSDSSYFKTADEKSSSDEIVSSYQQKNSTGSTNFNVCSLERKETVLHLVLRQPLLFEKPNKDGNRKVFKQRSHIHLSQTPKIDFKCPKSLFYKNVYF